MGDGDSQRTVATVRKNNTQEVRVRVSDQKGYALVVQRHSELTPLRHEELPPMPFALSA